MLRGEKVQKVEFQRRHMIAVRLVDAINFAMRAVPWFKPILGGFRLCVSEVRYAQYPNKLPRLEITPAGWPKGSMISCILCPQDGHSLLGDGEINFAGQHSVGFGGWDVGGGIDYQPRQCLLTLNLRLFDLAFP